MGKSLNGKELGKGISQRTDGLFVARKMINGKTVKVTGKSLTEVRVKFKEAVRKEKTKYTADTTFNDWYEVWFENIKLPKLKCDLSGVMFRNKYERTYPKILGDRKIGDIKHIDIQKATSDMINSGIGVTTVNVCLSSTRQIFKYAVANGLILVNPCVDVYVNKDQIERRPSFALEDWIIDLFFECMKGKCAYELFRVLLLTGTRIGELSALRWEDIDFERKVIHIRRSVISTNVNGKAQFRFVVPKTTSGVRTIPFVGDIEEVLKNWKIKRDEIHERLLVEHPDIYEERFRDLVFVVTSDGRPYIIHNYRLFIRQNLKRMKIREQKLAEEEGREPREIPLIHSHLFRHTFATKCFEAGVAPIYVKTILGHESYAMTLHYTHTTETKEKSEIEKLDTAMACF